MPRYAAVVEYNGQHYAGYQWQDHAVSVQQRLDEALSKVAANSVISVCAGRTDAGVHATHQVVHFDSPVERPDRAWRLGSNNHLPPDLAIRWAGRVADDFHARFSAVARCYRYVILNDLARTAHAPAGVTLVHESLDSELMQVAAQAFVGEQDFSSVRAASCQSPTAWRNVHFCNVTRLNRFVVVEIQANAFLHHMVRNIVGLLIKVGTGDLPVSRINELIRARDRRLAPATAAPDGLYLVGVKYPARFQFPMLAPGPLYLPDRL